MGEPVCLLVLPSRTTSLLRISDFYFGDDIKERKSPSTDHDGFKGDPLLEDDPEDGEDVLDTVVGDVVVVAAEATAESSVVQ